MKKMNHPRTLAAGLALAMALGGAALGQPQEGQATAPAVRKIGSVKAVSGNTITLQPDSGPEVKVQVQESTRLLRMAPGQTDLKTATPMQLQDVQVGDRMLARGKAGEDGQSLIATSVIVMKQTDVAQKQQHDLQDWQRRGVGGIVTAIDVSTGAITVSVTPTISATVRTSKSTGFLRYAPESVKFADAQRGSFDQIKIGDQLRARGERSADGKELAAEEVISGTFRNIAGTVASVDAAGNTITVKDVLSKKTVVVKVTPDSQMRKLPPQMAQGIAFFLKGGMAQGQPGRTPPASAGTNGPPSGLGGRPSAPPDFQRMLSRIPAATLADLQKEDAVMIVSSQGTGTTVTAITLLSGVEPILSSGSAATLLSGWSMSSSAGDATGGVPQ